MKLYDILPGVYVSGKLVPGVPVAAVYDSGTLVEGTIVNAEYVSGTLVADEEVRGK